MLTVTPRTSRAACKRPCSSTMPSTRSRQNTVLRGRLPVDGKLGRQGVVSAVFPGRLLHILHHALDVGVGPLVPVWLVQMGAAFPAGASGPSPSR
jgi:hypothetical protein